MNTLDEVKDQLALNLTATYFKLVELERLIISDHPILERLDPEAAAAVVAAMAMQRASLEERLQAQAVRLAFLMDKETPHD